jgi:hypothetical protein
VTKIGYRTNITIGQFDWNRRDGEARDVFQETNQRSKLIFHAIAGYYAKMHNDCEPVHQTIWFLLGEMINENRSLRDVKQALGLMTHYSRIELPYMGGVLPTMITLIKKGERRKARDLLAKMGGGRILAMQEAKRQRTEEMARAFESLGAFEEARLLRGDQPPQSKPTVH